MLAGFLRVSADTGFKFAVSTSASEVGVLVANYYLVSAAFTLALALLRRMRFFAPRSGCPEVSLRAQALAQIIFALSLFSGNMNAIVGATALQRSIDKIFYQPTIQLLAAGFTPVVQEWLRQTHVTAFLCLGSFLGFVAFMGHGLLGGPQFVLLGMSLLHFIGALAVLIMVGVVVKQIIYALDREAKLAGVLGGSRPMAMLAMLSPRHFLVHALLWSKRDGKDISPELLEGLSADAGGEVVESFYSAFPELVESHQLALIRMAVFLDRENDRAFLIAVASEAVPGTLRARRLAAIHVVKTHGRMYRPLLRRARGKNSPLPVAKKIA